ncbi:hypothetical protein ACW0JT_02370 [Arthrobacter sp. SA17]
MMGQIGSRGGSVGVTVGVGEGSTVGVGVTIGVGGAVGVAVGVEARGGLGAGVAVTDGEATAVGSRVGVELGEAVVLSGTPPAALRVPSARTGGQGPACTGPGKAPGPASAKSAPAG